MDEGWEVEHEPKNPHAMAACGAPGRRGSSLGKWGVGLPWFHGYNSHEGW